MNKVFERYCKLIDGKFVIAVVILYLLVTILTFGLLNPILMANTNGNTLLELMIFFSPSTLYDAVEAYGSVGREIYVMFELGIDLIIPAVGALLYSSLSLLLATKIDNQKINPKALFYLGLIFCAADWGENFFIVAFVRMYPGKVTILAVLAETMTLLKCVAFISLMICIIFEIISLIKQRFPAHQVN